MSVLTGLQQVKNKWPIHLKGAKVGLVCHPASIDNEYNHAVDIFQKADFCKLTTLFGPQHGIKGHTQDNMIEWEGGIDAVTGLKLYSLYGKHRQPTEQMFANLDAIVIDLQDVGARYYTFIWTMDLIFKTAQACGIEVVVLDRPNPINGIDIEGNVLQKGFESFVGLRPLPMRHAMTIAEIANYFAGEFYPSLKLNLILMHSWQREMFFDETNLPWVMPSPNMPTLDTAIVYPGGCLLEATNVSEGRGTTRPFEIIGAPWIDAENLSAKLKSKQLSGLQVRPVGFQPTFQKYANELCFGVQLHVVDRKTFKSVEAITAIFDILKDAYPDKFQWKNPPYEYEYTKLPIDILAGCSDYRVRIDAQTSWQAMVDSYRLQIDIFNKTRQKYLLY